MKQIDEIRAILLDAQYYSHEVADLLPHLRRNTIISNINRLKSAGEVTQLRDGRYTIIKRWYNSYYPSKSHAIRGYNKLRKHWDEVELPILFNKYGEWIVKHRGLKQ